MHIRNHKQKTYGRSSANERWPGTRCIPNCLCKCDTNETYSFTKWIKKFVLLIYPAISRGGTLILYMCMLWIVSLKWVQQHPFGAKSFRVRAFKCDLNYRCFVCRNFELTMTPKAISWFIIWQNLYRTTVCGGLEGLILCIALV